MTPRDRVVASVSTPASKAGVDIFVSAEVSAGHDARQASSAKRGAATPVHIQIGASRGWLIHEVLAARLVAKAPLFLLRLPAEPEDQVAQPGLDKVLRSLFSLLRSPPGESQLHPQQEASVALIGDEALRRASHHRHSESKNGKNIDNLQKIAKKFKRKSFLNIRYEKIIEDFIK